jgi:diguanylate cyclase (GGDEF)-like protein/PAS domain S-box-containing protein
MIELADVLANGSLDQDHYQAALQATTAAIVVIDAKGIVRFFNPAAEGLFGYVSDEIVGQNVTLLMPEPYRSEHDGYLARYLIEGKGQVIGKGHEIAARTKDGEIFPIHLSVGVMNLGPSPLFVGVIIDITQQKRLESELSIAAAAFETHDAIMITDVAANILMVNRAFERITGYGAAEVVGRTPRILSSGRHDPQFYAGMWHTLRQVGEWKGEIWDRHKSGKIYPKETTITAVKNGDGATLYFVATFSDITVRKQAEADIYNLAYYDPLTGLANRRLLADKLKIALSVSAHTQHYGAALFLDLDRFKTANDTYGHETGDALLIEVANRLRLSVPHDATLAHLGGDEFVMVVQNLGQEASQAITAISTIAQKICEVIGTAYLLGEKRIHTTASIGISLLRGDSESPAEIVSRADIAMYQAKAQGGNQYQFFKEEYQTAALKRLSIEADLRKAIAEQQFVLYYQPQLDLRTQRLTGVEALIRWRHPERGLISPMEFIPIAEETGLIKPIGQWVLEQACRQLAEWRGGTLADITIAVNLTASQFLDPGLSGRIITLLRQYGVMPERLVLEVTESMSMTAPEQTIALMKELVNRGIALHIDDFGTGYSSLAYLKLFPLRTLKIDRSFVKDLESDQNSAEICEMMTMLAHKIGLDVIAEGVETDAQLKSLSAIGCKTLQGYLISKPLPAEEVERFIRTHHNSRPSG